MNYRKQNGEIFYFSRAQYQIAVMYQNEKKK